MIRPLRAAGRYVLERLGLRAAFAIARSPSLREDGWFRSFDEGRAIDAGGHPLPWLTYPAIELLSRRVQSAMSVFEFGSGWGTLWWASRVASVVACEHDASWHREMASRVPGNVTLLYEELEVDGEYCRRAARYAGRFDIVVIDGRDRVNCAIQSVVALSPQGVFVWDNTDRPEYAPGLLALQAQGFLRIELVGLSPGATVKTETSILYRPGNCLGL